MTELQTKALEFATKFHGEQRRKDGELYINHCIRVADNLLRRNTFFGEQEWAIAVLHDVLEDTDATYDMLVDEFGDYVAHNVVTLTRCDGTTYLDYILAIKKSGVASRIKDMDLLDNLNGATGTLRDKYMMARYILGVVY